MTQKDFAVAPHGITQHAHDTSRVVGDVTGSVRTSRRTTSPNGSSTVWQEASGHALGCALLLRGIRTLV